MEVKFINYRVIALFMKRTLEEMLGIYTKDEFLKVVREKYENDPTFRLPNDPQLYRLFYKRRFDWEFTDKDGDFSLSDFEKSIIGEARSNEYKMKWTKETILYCVAYFVNNGISFTSENPIKERILLPSGRVIVTSPREVYNNAQKHKEKWFTKNGRFIGLNGLVSMACGDENDNKELDLKREVVEYWCSTYGVFGINGRLITPDLSWQQLAKCTGKTRKQLIDEALGDKSQ